MDIRIGEMGGGADFVRIAASAKARMPLFEGTGRTATDAREENDPGAVFFNRKQTEMVRIGFGADTVSLPGATLRTLGRNMKSVRRLVPSPEEAREEVRARISERREQAEGTADSQRQQILQPLGLAGKEAAAKLQARAFVNEINEAAGRAQARAEGQEPKPPEVRPTVRIGGENIEFLKPPTPPTLDLRV